MDCETERILQISLWKICIVLVQERIRERCGHGWSKKRIEWTKAVKETGEDKKHLKGSKRARLKVDVANKRFKKETVFFMETSK